jgi:hypothetical protein
LGPKGRVLLQQSHEFVLCLAKLRSNCYGFLNQNSSDDRPCCSVRGVSTSSLLLCSFFPAGVSAHFILDFLRKQSHVVGNLGRRDSTPPLPPPRVQLPCVFYHDIGAVLAGPRHGRQVTVPELRQPRAGLAQPRVRLPSRRVPTRDGAGHGAGEQVIRLTAGRAPGANEFKSKKTNNSTNRPNPA